MSSRPRLRRLIPSSKRVRRAWKSLLPALLILAIAAGVHILSSQASISGGLGYFNEPSVRTCSDAGTIFEGVRLAKDVRQLFQTTVSAVVAEREDYFSISSQWDCEKDAVAPRLMQLASRMPGWKYPVISPGPTISYQMRPVTFDAFSSILAEFLREYECKLTDLQGQSSIAITQGEDLGTLCVSNPCPEINVGDIASRQGAYNDFLQNERHRARVALERTLHTLRSFEVQYGAAKNLLCYERAVLDLRNEMSLLADATSCMPKIWDTVTSLHDRKKKL